MGLSIPHGFRLKEDIQFESFKKEIQSILYDMCFTGLAQELFYDSFNFYKIEDNLSGKEFMQKKYDKTLEGIKKVIETGVRNFQIQDVLCNLIFLKKDGIYYGLIDCDIPEVRDYFFSREEVRRYSPNAYTEFSEEEREEISVLWNTLLPSLQNRSGEYFVETLWVFIDYPRFEQVLTYINNHVTTDAFLKMKRKLLNYELLDKICLSKKITKAMDVHDELEKLVSLTKEEKEKLYKVEIDSFEKKYSQFLNELKVL